MQVYDLENERLARAEEDHFRKTVIRDLAKLKAEVRDLRADVFRYKETIERLEFQR